MDRHALTLALATCLVASAVGAQGYLPTDPPANPREIVPDQRLENVNQRLLLAVDRLQASQAVDQGYAPEEALAQVKQTLAEVRKVYDDIASAEERAPYLAAIERAQRAVEAGGVDDAIAALVELRDRVSRITASPAPRPG